MNNLKNKYTSLELSKKLAESGCKLGSNYYWRNYMFVGWVLENGKPTVDEIVCKFAYPAYDILWDICVKYARQFFGKPLPADLLVDIFMAMVSNKKQEAEDYIWENCLFNKKNKI